MKKGRSEIGEKFNALTLEQCFFYVENHKKYADFNVLGLYRSILENEKLALDEKLQLRDFAHSHFQKSFDFLQLKDPYTFVKVSTLGQDLTVADEWQVWKNVISNQEKILKDKRIKHRNFGVYSKHNCGHDTCRYNGLMVKQGSTLVESDMHFKSDKNKYLTKAKSDRIKKDRRTEKQSINRLIEDQ